MIIAFKPGYKIEIHLPGHSKCFYLLMYFALQLLHVITDLLLRHLGIQLGSLNAFVPQHLANCFNRNIIFKCYGGCKRVPGNMGREVLVDLADSRYFFQVSIVALVGIDRQQGTFGLAIKIVLVSVDYFESDRK